MSFRLYVVPVIGTGAKTDARRPKYFADGTVGATWSAMDYGFEPWMLVGADLSTTDDAIVVGQPDVMALPFDLDQLLTVGNVTTVQNKLEAINLSGDWVTTDLTWRDVVHGVCGIFQYMQRFAGIHGVTRLFVGGITLDTTMGQLPAGARNDLIVASDSLNLDRSSITLASTIRQVEDELGRQMAPRELVIGVPI